MRAGKLTSTITIERASTTVDAYGVPQETWTTFATVRAQVITSTTEEFMRTFGASSEAAIVFRVRFLAGLTLADRITFKGRAYNLVEIKELGRRAGLDLRCTATGA